MFLLGKKAIVLLLAASASLGVHAAPAPHVTQPIAAAQKVQLLGGKFTLKLPPGFESSPLPAGEAASGTAGATGTMYANPQTQSVVLVAENLRTDGVTIKDNDKTFLDSAASNFLDQQRKALPDFTQQDQKTLTLGGLGVRQIDSHATQGGGKTLSTTLLAGSGNRTLVVQVISREDALAKHRELVKWITAVK